MKRRLHRHPLPAALALLIALLLALCLAACGGSAPAEETAEEPPETAAQETVPEEPALSPTRVDLGQWERTETGTAYDTYECGLTSDETEPFLAVFSDGGEDFNYAYLENGTGTLRVSLNKEEGTDALLAYRAIGYLAGEIPAEDAVTVLEEPFYSDLITLDESICNWFSPLELTEGGSGLLLADVTGDTRDQDSTDNLITVAGGRGMLYYIYMDLACDERIESLRMVPRFFCEAEEVGETDYATEQALSVEKTSDSEHTAYNGEEVLRFDGFPDGLIFYTVTLVSGGDEDDRGEPQANRAALRDGLCTLKAYTGSYADDHASLEEPVFDVQVTGFLTWTPLEGSAAPAAALPSPARDAYDEACNLYLSDLEHATPMGFDVYRFKGMILDEEELESWEPGNWLEGKMLNQDLMFNAMANQLEEYLRLFPNGYDAASQYGVSFWESYGTLCSLLWGASETNDDADLRPRFQACAQWMITDQTGGRPFLAIMERLSRCQSVTGTYPSFTEMNDGDTFIVDIPDLTATARELEITDAALGYVLAKLAVYMDPNNPDNGIDFDGNGVHIEINI